jgi:NADH-quinone oxidoreductase subunit L
MLESLGLLGTTLATAPGHGAAAAGAAAHGAADAVAHAAAATDMSLSVLIPLLPLLGFALCGACAAFRQWNKLPAYITLGCLGTAFVITLVTFLRFEGHGASIAPLFDWITYQYMTGTGQNMVAHTFVANFSFYIDGLTLLWMLFVTGLATLIALYSSEYMVHDVGPGYCRFFAAFNLFVFSMSCLVMSDNLLLLFLGWEGVGLCSYLLIGYYYKKPAAVAAAKKAFIVNRIGDLGLILGIMSCYVVFGSVEYRVIFDMISRGVDATGHPIAGTWVVDVIPMLLTAGAFGKSAQIFFYVWLPDAMEGPTPVSALIHAATMVTAGVFLIARMYPLFAADTNLTALTFVAWSGAITAFWAATIEMAIFDIKRVMGYSTISQLGFMFAGLGVLTPQGASFHTFTHAFFKATLFLGVGAVMHGFGGQLDLRRLSGVAWMRGFGLVGTAMLVGSINLSGVPFTAGFFSKDMILAQAFTTPGTMIAGAEWVAWLLLLTAGMTAYYTFRTFFRVYAGPKQFIPGDDAELLDLGRHPKGTSLDEWHAQHGHGHGHGHGHEHGHAGHGSDHGHADSGHAAGSVADRRVHTRPDFDPSTEEFDPHPPGMAMKIAIGACMLCSILAAGAYFMTGGPGGEHGGWVATMVHGSSANYHGPEHGGTFLGMDPHKVMYYVSALVGLIGILIAAYLHGPSGWQGLFIGNRTECGRSRADNFVPAFGFLVPLARAKWYVDEIYDYTLRKPLWVLANIYAMVDKLLVDGLVDAVGAVPKWAGRSLRPSQSGLLHGYAIGMAGGVAFILVIVLVVSLA